MISFAASAVILLATAPPQDRPMNLFDFTVADIDGKEVSLSKFKGKVALVVNVATYCGLTPQYEGLEALNKKYRDRGLVVLGFPANEFGEQEPGTNEEIKKFCTEKYNVTFPMFSKIVVKGKGIHPLYDWLVKTADRHEEIEWNFAKFLVNRQGKVVRRFTPRTKPDDAALLAEVEAELNKPD